MTERILSQVQVAEIEFAKSLWYDTSPQMAQLRKT